jgi:predicted membrane protein
VEARVGFGELEIVLPRDVAVDVTGDVKWGEVDVLGRGEDGRDSREHFVDAGFFDADRRLVLDADVRGGELNVRR